MMPILGQGLYAHSAAEGEWETLDRHLSEVAHSAAEYAAVFGAREWGDVLGQCHDLGKASDAFQTYLRQSQLRESQDAGAENLESKDASIRRVDHSTFGARYVMQQARVKLFGELLAYCIAGHHAGLADAVATDDANGGAALRSRLDPLQRVIPIVDDPGVTLPALTVPFLLKQDDLAFPLAFFSRMLFSCLIDADRSCTEAFCNPSAEQERSAPRPSLAELRAQLDIYLGELKQHADASPVNDVRRGVLQECCEAAALAPGFFSLQVPTGGGKTLSSLAFALRHAEGRHRRVIVAIPFTSIIEQTADVYRRALGTTAARGIVEHHTNLQPERDTRANQLATENWDAPLVVTTNVQFFESMFAAATTPCRKLHRLAKSVIILDEAQTLPVELLAPSLRALRELVERYGCSVVLCTATQPALHRREGFACGIENVRPIISNPQELFDRLRRVEVHHAGKLSDGELVTRLAAETKVLTVVNTRSHAATLFTELRTRVEADSCFHLSTLMCGAHRRMILKRIRGSVKNGSCRVVSTQLIEAGVDLDFPVVYRAEAGFDSIAQAAGRCNREGRLTGLGQTYVFEAETPPPPGFLRNAAHTARELFPRHPDPLAPCAVEAYFRLHYWKSADQLDKHEVLSQLSVDLARGQSCFQFREVAARYRLIRDTQKPVLVPYGARARKYLCALGDGRIPFIPQRDLQPFLVSIPERSIRALEAQGVARAHESGVWLLLRPDAYDRQMGLKLDSIGLDASLWGM
jgi:CRISPR-associated endonuclease/helicase Cas3